MGSSPGGPWLACAPLFSMEHITLSEAVSLLAALKAGLRERIFQIGKWGWARVGTWGQAGGAGPLTYLVPHVHTDRARLARLLQALPAGGAKETSQASRWHTGALRQHPPGARAGRRCGPTLAASGPPEGGGQPLAGSHLPKGRGGISRPHGPEQHQPPPRRASDDGQPRGSTMRTKPGARGRHPPGTLPPPPGPWGRRGSRLPEGEGGASALDLSCVSSPSPAACTWGECDPRP